MATSGKLGLQRGELTSQPTSTFSLSGRLSSWCGPHQGRKSSRRLGAHQPLSRRLVASAGVRASALNDETQLRCSLGQCGTSFKESALRILSLFLKFHPLRKESLWRPAPSLGLTQAVRRTQAPPSGSAPEARLLEPGSLGTASVPLRGGLSVCAPWWQLLPAGPMVNVRRRRQKDPDAAVGAAQNENLLLKSKCEELHRSSGAHVEILLDHGQV